MEFRLVCYCHDYLDHSYQDCHFKKVGINIVESASIQFNVMDVGLVDGYNLLFKLSRMFFY